MQPKPGNSAPLPPLQTDFMDYICAGELETIQHRIQTPPGGDPQQRLSIYYDGYRLRLLEILGIAFPKLKVLIGEDAFRTLGMAYISAHPSPYFSLNYYGDKLSQFLSEQPHYFAEPYLKDMAKFEWRLEMAFEAIDQLSLTPEILQTIPLDKWGELRFKFLEATTSLWLEYNVPEVWKMIAASEEKGPYLPSKYEKPICWLVSRDKFKTEFWALTENAGFAFEIMKKENSFAVLCEKLCERLDAEQVPLFALQCLNQWLTDGIVTEVTYSQ